ncbi:MAG: UvrB/UvrC motif-containing protein [Gemmatimonadota bacterium]|nr:UvrB/UvrC motif-containing protein [Gemmatimonadota bacterium]
MECQECGLRAAKLQVTAIIDGQMRTLELCSECAAKRGAAGMPPVPLADFLAQLGPESAGSGGSGDPCPFCGITEHEFRQTGRLGCSQCYAHFEPQLRGLLRRLHGSPQHVGKLYMSAGSEAGDRVARLSAMRRRLTRAVETEDFELAAELRDRIREAENAE